MDKQEIKALVSDGHFFTVEFVKRSTGQLRKLNGLVKRPKPDSKPAYNFDHHNLIPMWSIKDKGYRAVPIENILWIRAKGKFYDFTEH